MKNLNGDKIELNLIIFFINMDIDNMESHLISVPHNKLVLKKQYIIITHEHGLVYTGTFYYMFGGDAITDILGLCQPVFIDVKPNIENKSLLICSAYDKFYDLKVKME